MDDVNQIVDAEVVETPAEVTETPVVETAVEGADVVEEVKEECTEEVVA